MHLYRAAVITKSIALWKSELEYKRPCGLAVYHNNLCRSINAVNSKQNPSFLTDLSFEKGQTLRLIVNSTLKVGMMQLPTCKGLWLK